MSAAVSDLLARAEAYAEAHVPRCHRAAGYYHRYCCDAHATVLNGQLHGDLAEGATECWLRPELLRAERTYALRVRPWLAAVDADRYLDAIRGARQLRHRVYEAGLLWKPGTHIPRSATPAAPAPWPLFGERATTAERSRGVPAGTVAGSEARS